MKRFSSASALLKLSGTVVLGLALTACAGSSSVEPVGQRLDQTTPTRQTVAETALDQVGDAYAPNMAGPDQFDSAGLAYFAYRQHGRPLPRALVDQLNAGQPIDLTEAEPGDLAFLRLDDNTGQGHLAVGILIGPDSAVIALPGAADNGGGVRRIALSDDYWRGRFIGVVRILPAPGAPTRT